MEFAQRPLLTYWLLCLYHNVFIHSRNINPNNLLPKSLPKGNRINKSSYVPGNTHSSKNCEMPTKEISRQGFGISTKRQP